MANSEFPVAKLTKRQDQGDTLQLRCNDLPHFSWIDGFPLGDTKRIESAGIGDEVESTLYSVTANSPAEAEELATFRAALPRDLLEVLDSVPQLSAPPDSEPPERSVKHHIRLVPDAVLLKRGPYPLSGAKLASMRLQMEELTAAGWIEPSSSSWGALVLLVPKKSGEFRMCDDFRDLNAVTIDDSYPLPRLDVLLHRAGQARVFSKIDLASGFHQIEVHPKSRAYTAFRLPEPFQGHALWQWKVMPFGLRNAPPTFQRAMAVALDGSDHCAVVYIDDILIFSASRREHLQHLALVLLKLQAHAYHARLSKCEFLRDEVEFLGYRLTARGITTVPDKVQTLLNWPVPLTSRAQVKSFLGLVVWYRSFIPHMASIAAPLFEMTSDRRKFEWTETASAAMARLKELVSSAPVLVRWDEALATRVVTDASKVGLGAVLEQQHPDGWKPVAFWSRKLKDPETRYSATC